MMNAAANCWSCWRCWAAGGRAAALARRRCSFQRDPARRRPVSAQQRGTIRANAAPRLAGSFFTLDLQQARAPSSRCPGCARRWCAACGPAAWRARWKSTSRRRCGWRHRRRTTAGQHPWRGVRGQPRRRRRRQPAHAAAAPMAAQAAMLAMMPRLLARCWAPLGGEMVHAGAVDRGSWRANSTTAPSGRTGPRQRRRGGGPHRTLRAHAAARCAALPAPAGITPTCATRRLCRAPQGRDDQRPAAARLDRKPHNRQTTGQQDKHTMAKEYKDLVVGLDIGTAKVMAVVAEVLPGGELRLAGLGVAPSARPEARRGGQHRRHRAEHPAGAERGRDDGRLQDRPRLHRHHRQPHPRPEQHRHGHRARQPRGHAGGRAPRGRDRQGHQHPQRPAPAAGGAAGVRDRRPRGEGADRHERQPARGEGAHRDRRAERGREHPQVRAPLRPGSGAAGAEPQRQRRRRADRGREDAGRGAGRHRRRHHRRASSPTARSATPP
jgi:hypothetical protein